MFVADLHSITNGIINNNPYDLIKFWLFSLKDIPNIYYYIQSELPMVCELSWIFTCNTSVSQLKRMTQFKEKSDKDNTNGGFLIYPMLMAADILIPKATHVPVGADQRQHVEMARDVADYMNKKYNTKFVIPEIIIHEECNRIMDLRDPTKKMSKSNEDAKGTIFITDTNEIIINKIKNSVTDSLMMPDNIRDISKSRPGIYNLCTIYKVLKKCDFSFIEKTFGGGNISDFKHNLSELIIETIEPIRNFMENTSNDYVRSILDDHKNIVMKDFESTMNEVKNIFFNYEQYK
jgi:tryptophanyl-tRNA synthetase